MQVAVLASGSKGNATFVEMDGKKILVDAGISTRRIRQELSAIGQDIGELDGVFITHEHSDHIKGLATMVKKYRTNIYARPDTFRAMKCLEEFPLECIHPIVNSVRLDRVVVKAFEIPHDAADPVGYIIQGTRRCVVATDMGFINDAICRMLEGAHVLVLESNHDEEMLKNGSYPYSLKQRILGRLGHLSNRAAAMAVAGLKQHPQKLLLAHLSEENNRPELAIKTVTGIFDQYKIDDIEIYMTAQDRCVAVDF